MHLEPIIPTRKEVEMWRLSAEAAIKFDSVRLGEFNWPWVVLSLIAGWEKGND